MCQDERSQYLNKIKCIKELRRRIKKSNFKPPKRIKTKPTKSSVEKRLSEKKYHSEKKKIEKILILIVIKSINYTISTSSFISNR